MKSSSAGVRIAALAAVAALGLLSAVVLVGCKEEKPAAPAAGAPAAGMVSPFANVRCPIMGSPIDPATVPDSLVREFQGKKVAFCCGACPPAWDKLTDAEKAEHLAKAAAPEDK